MIHLGDITKIHGDKIPVVDVITGGSPCQDLSVAGKRAGLAGERSGLFMEQIRIVKEMRERDRSTGRTAYNIRPRYMVWENVPGAFSSNKGQDFKAVLEEIVKISGEKAPDLPDFDGGGYSKAGCIADALGKWSIAWRVHDAQFWGVPQRRKRIALVADFGGLSAPEILFERKGLRWDPSKGEEARERTAWRVKRSTGETGACYCLNDQGGAVMSLTEDVVNTLRAQEHGHQPIVYNGVQITSKANKSNPKPGDPCHSLTQDSRNYLVNCKDVMVVEPRTQDGALRIYDGIVPTLNTASGGQRQPCVVRKSTYSNDSYSKYSENDHGASLKACGGVLGGGSESLVVNCTDVGFFTSHEEQAWTLLARQYKDPPIVNVNQLVRRLTPLECERLQGFPDYWTDIGEWTDTKGKRHKESSDGARYKALGNSIALPFWFYLLRRIAAQYERPATLGSLFDGIGGFPLCWERCNGKGTAIWASEIEEFPIAVTKAHFPE